MSPSEHPDLEQALRRMLRPIEPPPGFEERVAAAIARSRREADVRAGSERWFAAVARLRRSRMRPAWALASAAAVAVAILAGALTYHGRMQQASAERTQSQALEALRIADEKLDTAFRLIGYQRLDDSPGPPRGGRIN